MQFLHDESNENRITQANAPSVTTKDFRTDSAHKIANHNNYNHNKNNENNNSNNDNNSTSPSDVTTEAKAAAHTTTTTTNNNKQQQTTTTTTTTIKMRRTGNTTTTTTTASTTVKRTRVSKVSKKIRPLPAGFVPSDFDVVCGKGKDCFNRVGNRRFRELVAHNLDVYQAAQTKLDKSAIVISIVDAVRRSSPNGGGFVRRNNQTGLWFEIGDAMAREKVGHTIRETLVLHNPEKNKDRRVRRAFNKKRRLGTIGNGTEGSGSNKKTRNNKRSRSTSTSTSTRGNHMAGAASSSRRATETSTTTQTPQECSSVPGAFHPQLMDFANFDNFLGQNDLFPIDPVLSSFPKTPLLEDTLITDEDAKNTDCRGSDPSGQVHAGNDNTGNDTTGNDNGDSITDAGENWDCPIPPPTELVAQNSRDWFSAEEMKLLSSGDPFRDCGGDCRDLIDGESSVSTDSTGTTQDAFDEEDQEELWQELQQQQQPIQAFDFPSSTVFAL